MNKEIQDWIKQVRKNGMTNDAIKDQLSKQGWNDSQIFELLEISKKENRTLKKAFFLSLILILIIGGVIYYFLFALMAGFALGGDEGGSKILIPSVLILFTIFIWIVYRFKKRNEGNKNTKKYLVILILIVIISPFLAFYGIKLSMDLGSAILDKKVERSNQCDDDLFGSLIKVNDVRDSHNKGDSYITLELDIIAQKDLSLSLENNAGVSYTGENFGTQLFRARWEREKPWNKAFRHTDEGQLYYDIEIPKGSSTIGVTLDAEFGYLGKDGYKNDVAVKGLMIDGPYRVQLPLRITSEKSTCLFDELNKGYEGAGYTPRILLLPDGYETTAYSWQDF